MEIRSLTEAYALSEKVSAFQLYDGTEPGEFRFKATSKDELFNSLKAGSYKSISEIICNYANNNDIMTSKIGNKEGARPKPKLRGKFLFKRDEIQLDAKKEVDAELEQKKKQLEQALADKWGPIVTRDEPPIEPNLDLMPMSERDLSILNCSVMSSAASARRKYPSVEGASIEEKLLFAAQNALPDLAGNLIEAGADVNYVSPETGKTPLLAAATSSTRFVILRLLEEPSVDHLVRDKSGQIAVGIFAEKAPADDPLVEQLVNAAMEQAKERGIEFSSLFSLPVDTPYPS